MSRKCAYLTIIKVNALFKGTYQGRDGCCLAEVGLLSPEKTFLPNFSQTKTDLLPSADYCSGLLQIKAFK
jgi:hypothetical protein